ncbi:MAG TPA: YkvA family protein [Gemmatimonadaceae bacterium]|nr:YkvA family protein [Gemmatimonadaceae bacterium]
MTTAKKRTTTASGRRARRLPSDVKVESVPRTGAKRTVMGTISELPNFLRLLYGLITDSRVNAVDKLVVAGAIAYILLPVDVIPDFIPFLGEVDDVFLLVLALQRLIANAGRTVLHDYWVGDPAELTDLNLEKILAACVFFLPRRMRRRLKTIGRL